MGQSKFKFIETKQYEAYLFVLWDFWLEKEWTNQSWKSNLTLPMLFGILFKVNFWQCRTQGDNGDGLYKIMNQPKRKIRTNGEKSGKEVIPVNIIQEDLTSRSINKENG